MWLKKSNVALSLVLVLLVLMLGGCGSPQEKSLQSSSESNATAEQKAGAGPGFAGNEKSQTQNSAVKRKIIKSAVVAQRVSELDAAVKKLEGLVDASGGFIQSSSFQELDKDTREAHFTLRIPESSYTSILQTIEKIGENIASERKGQDVTAEYYDNEARIKNLKLQEQAVQNLYEQARKMDDILKIQQELFRIRGEIEALQGRNKNLDNLSELSTIEVTIREVKQAELTGDSAWKRAKEGFFDSLTAVGSLFTNVFVFLVAKLPILLFVVIPIGLAIWWGVRRSRQTDKK